VVRLVRGRPRSVPLAEALAAARAGIEGGCGEVVLSGIDLGAWRDGQLGADARQQPPDRGRAEQARCPAADEDALDAPAGRKVDWGLGVMAAPAGSRSR
jgi:hypothetical protein